MAINYASKYAQKIDEKFARESITSAAVSAARGVRDSNFVSGMAVPPLLVYNGNVCRRRGK